MTSCELTHTTDCDTPSQDNLKTPLLGCQSSIKGKESLHKTTGSNITKNATNLLYRIDLYKSCRQQSLADVSTQSFQRFSQYMASFLGENDADIADTQNPEFLLGFAQFLQTSKQFSTATTVATLAELRKVTRQAIRDGLIPNVDIFPQCYASLQNLAQPLGETKIAMDVSGDVDKLIKLIENWSYERLDRPSSLTPAERRKIHEKATNYRCLTLYLFGLIFYGLEIEDLLALEPADAQEMVYVPKYGRSLPIPPFASRLAFIYNLSSRDKNLTTNKSRLLNIPHSPTGTDSIAEKALEAKKRIRRVLNTNSINLFRSGSIYDDRISLLMDCGMEVDHAITLLAAKRHNKIAEIDDILLQHTVSLIQRRNKALTDNWYLLRPLPGQRVATIKNELRSSGLIGDEQTSYQRIYNPIDWMAGENGKINSPLSNFLFFKVTESGVSAVAKKFKNKGYVLRTMSRSRYAAISDNELRQMQLAIRDFRDDIELIDKTAWLKQNSDKLKIGGKVRIMTGNLKGKEATIVNITGTGGNEGTIYLLEYIAGALTFKTRLHNIELAPLT